MFQCLRLGTVIAVPIFFILPASASDWVQVTAVPTLDFSGADVYLDLDNMKVQGQRREFWQKVVFHAEKQNSYQKGYVQSLSLKTVDCAADTWGVTLEVQYDRKGLIVSSYTSSLEMHPATPSTSGKVVNDLVCR